MICQYCFKECKNSNSHKNHEKRCPKNKNRVYKNGMTGKKHSEKTIEKMQNSQQNVNRSNCSGENNSFFGKHHSEETKHRISEIRKKFLEENPDKTPYVLNHSSKISYPEQYFIDCFSKYINVAFQFHVFRYFLDFANIEEKLYLEIDGDQHYFDKRIIEHDERRTKKLSELGWIRL